MRKIDMKMLIFLFSILLVSLAGCAPVEEAAPGDEAGTAKNLNELVAAVRETGAEVETGDSIEQPFFPVTGQVLVVNGSQVQVFEFADETTRRQVSETISASGDQIGTFMPSWIDQPNFWANGRLIVLYLGQDQSLIDTLSGVLGDPITEADQAGDLPPQAVLEGQQVLVEALGVGTGEVELIEVDREEWSDSCLGLGGPAESCLTVITSGWRAIFEVNGQRYEVRTDESGEAIRWQELGELPPQVVLEGQQVLAEELGVETGKVELIEVERMDWSDSCLGLGGPAESCLAEITPGWQAIFEVNGQLFEVRTDESGEAIRWQELDHLPPQAVVEGQRVLAEELGVGTGEVELIEVEHMDWSDGCLGLGRPDEGCLTVITPGWRAVFEVNGKRYEVRTDESGEAIRWQELGEAPDEAGTPESSSQAFMYMVSVGVAEDEGGIGCGDSLVPVEIKIEDENQPIKNALSQLLSVGEQFYGENRYYNALYQSDLVVDSVLLDSSGTATVRLSGEIILGGVCDEPRVEAQLERTAVQFENVDSADFYLNGQPLEDFLSGAG